MKNKSKKRLIAEIIFLLAALSIFAFYLQRHAPHILKILESGNITEIDDYLNTYGPEGKYLLVLLQVIETISIILPAMPVYICAGILFGKVQGILICYVTNLILNILIFLTAHKLKAIGGHTSRIENQKFVGKMIANAKHMDRVVLAMCWLPIVPNGMIPYLSAQTKVTLPEFTKALAIGSLPSIAIYVSCGDILISDSYRIIIPVIIVLAILAILALIFKQKLIAIAEPKLKAFIEN